LTVITVSLLFLAVLSISQVRRAAGAFEARERDTLEQSARIASRELAYLINQEENRLVEQVELNSLAQLRNSLVRIEETFPGVACFVLMQDGSLLHPESDFDERIDVVLKNKGELIGLLGAASQGRTSLPSGDAPVFLSLYRLVIGSAIGMIGICWDKHYVDYWCESVALDILPEEYALTILDKTGRTLFRHPEETFQSVEQAAKTEFRVDTPLAPGAFPWTLNLRHVDPARIQRLIRRQEIFHVVVLLFLTTVTGGGVFLLGAVVVKERELGRLKADFAANVSHELRTPLALIRAAGEAMASRPNLDRPRSDRYLGIITRESRRLGDLINTVLGFADSDRRTKTWNLLRTDICAFVRQFVDDYRLHLDEAGFSVSLRVPDAPVFCDADSDALHLVLVNLLDNAVKFSPENKEISVTLERIADRATLSIEDKGIGIDKHDQERIFDTFFRVERDLVKKTRGTGIGLSLVKQIVAAHGGEISLTSKTGKGTKFTVLLPLAGDHGEETQDA